METVDEEATPAGNFIRMILSKGGVVVILGLEPLPGEGTKLSIARAPVDFLPKETLLEMFAMATKAIEAEIIQENKPAKPVN